MLRRRLLQWIGPARPRQPWVCHQCLTKRAYAQQAKKAPTLSDEGPPDHRVLGNKQKLFMNSVYSPGSPIFLPNGARIFNRLVTFLREQYVRYGFQEVITPTIYKKSLWEKSGHLQNYADDMYYVTGNEKKATDGCCGSEQKADAGDADDGFGMKPMNCPGHCLVFASELRSYRDLPIRYADFSPLHRNEISGALSGLTRVRRFHQDDGHIFCRPIQVEEEIKKTLDFVKVVYNVLKLSEGYRLELSTRPKDHYMGTEEEWERAEGALRRALDQSGMEWTVNEGDGAFYGPKIDIVIKDSDGKEHQTATIQLDFQLPKRFELEYMAPAAEYEARGEEIPEDALTGEYGPVRPVMIHRAVLGSVERLMALLIEKYNKTWPFWLNPRQVMILTTNTTPTVMEWAETVRKELVGDNTDVYERLAQGEVFGEDESVNKPTGLAVDVDGRKTTVGVKIREASIKGYGEILVIGPRDAENKTVTTSSKETVTKEVMRTRLVNRVNSFQ
ncbi:tRNA synthetase class II core domain (G, h, p, S and t) domain-containing protein [Sarocladium implicatum]|nr:tRNA synthetase class II core domain (G, h, p, S and t) domain-containing protein [Sarocladium implicatum]